MRAELWLSRKKLNMTFTYTVDLRPEFASAQTFPATITDIRDGDGDDLLDVAARFPGRQELEDLGSFTVQLHGAALNVLSVSYYEPTLGAFDGLPMGGVIKGVFEALTGEHHINLDAQREALLHGREIAASVGVSKLQFGPYTAQKGGAAMIHLTPLDRQRQWYEPLADTAMTVTPLYIAPLFGFPGEDLDCMTDVSWLDDEDTKRGILLSECYAALSQEPEVPHLWNACPTRPLSMEFTRRAFAAAYAAWTTALEEVGGPSGVPTLMYYVDGHLEVQKNENQY